MEDAEKAMPGRTRVRKLLLARLAAAGLERPRRMTLEAQAAQGERLVARLAYMSAEGLEMLAENVIQLAGGPLRNAWPQEATVLNLARRIERPPPRSDRIVASFMRSAAGRRAWEEDPLIAAELRRHLIETRLPPTDWHWAEFRETATYRRRRIEGAQARRAEGRETGEDVARLAEWADERPKVEAMVFPKPEETSDAA